MKKSFLWIVLLGLAFGFSSCKNDDPKPDAPIVGAWVLSKYTLTEMPANFKSYENATTGQLIGFETGYTFEFFNNGTYSRAYIVDARYTASSIYDGGKYTLDGTKLTVNPSNAGDIDLIDLYGTVGTNFSVVGEITDVRMTLSATGTVYLLPDSVDPATATNDDLAPADCTIVYTFTKLVSK